MIRSLSLAFTAAFLAMASGAGPLRTQAVAGSQASPFHGQDVRILVGMPPGGGVDLYARLLQKFMSRRLAGGPTVIVANMPGAGSLRSVMALKSEATPNVALVDTFSSALLTQSVVEPKRAPVDFRDFAFLGNVAEDSRVCYVRSSLGVQRIAALQGRPPLNFGATAPGTSGNVDVSMLKNLFHVRLNEILGYAGSAAKALAIDRGEIDGDCAGVTSIPADWIKSNKIKILLRFSPVDPAGVPSNVAFGGDLISDAIDRKAYDFLVAPQRLGRLFMVSRRMPAAQLAALRSAFDATMKDPEFLAASARAHSPVEPTSGVVVDRMVSDLMSTPPAVVHRAREVLAD